MSEPITLPRRVVEVTCPDCEGEGSIERNVDGADVEVICTTCGPPNLDGAPNSGRVETYLPAVTLPEPTVRDGWDFRTDQVVIGIDPDWHGPSSVGLIGSPIRWFELDTTADLRALAAALLLAADVADAAKAAANGEAHPVVYRWQECICGERYPGSVHPNAIRAGHHAVTACASMVKPDWWPNP